jgi:hypothetical protein
MGKGEKQEMKRIAYKGYLVHQKFYRIIGIEGKTIASSKELRKTRGESLPSNFQEDRSFSCPIRRSEEIFAYFISLPYALDINII